MKHTVIILLSVSLAIVLVGCQESESAQIRKARVIGNENIQLKKELEEKNQQIEDLEKKIEEIETKSAEDIQKAGDTSIKAMRLLLESEKRNEALSLEIENLKEELEKLKAQ
jgi:hypothetical protein